MKTKLHLSKAIIFVFALATQFGLAQTGGPFGGTIPSIVNGTVIQFEDFDLGANETGGTAPFGYSDSTPGNVANPGTSYTPSTYRSGEGHDVDLIEHIFANPPQNVSNGQIGIGAVANGEFLYYTVTVGETSSDYFIRINYGHGNAVKRRYRIEKLDLTLANPVTLVDASDNTGANALPSTGNSFTLADFDIPSTFTLTAGETFVLKFTYLDGGPVNNYIQFINNPGTLSVDAFDAKSIFVSNPISNSIEIKGLTNDVDKVEVFNLLGKSIIKQNTNGGSSLSIDATSLSSGMYLVKIFGGDTVVTKKIIKN